MKDDFTAPSIGAPFVDCFFQFKGNRYHLQCFNDAEGNANTIKLEPLIKITALVYAVEREAETFSEELQRGVTLAAMAERYAARPGDSLYVVQEEGGKQRLATGIWSAAFQVANSKYQNEAPLPRRELPSFLRVIEGGMA